MRICLYTATALPKLGGQEAVVDSLARHFQKLGHDPVVLAPQPRRPLRAHDSEFPYPVVRHPRFVSTRDFVSWYRVFLKRLHARRHFDIIHCHDVYPTGYLAGLCKPKLHIPLVITSHGGDVRENNPRLERGPIPQRLRAALHAADVLVSIAPFTERNFKRLYPDAPHIVTIPNGIDLAPYQSHAPRPAALDPSIQPGNFFLYLGRLAHRKGVDVLLKAFSQIGNTPKLVIAGTGDDELTLKDTSAALGLTDRVHFVGRVEGADKIFLLQNAIATIMPSRVWEAFPLVVLETFAAGRPLIGTRVPGIADLIEESKTGRLFTDENPDELAQILRDALADREKLHQMGTAARDVANRYSWESVAQKHIDLYQQLIRG